MKIFGYLSFALCVLLSPLSSYAGNDAAKARILTGVKSGQMTPQAALAQAQRFGIDLTADLAAYFFPAHWEQFFNHFNGLAYDQLVLQLTDVAQRTHGGAFVAPSLQDIPNIPVRNPGTPLSQWLTNVRDALFNNGGKLQHNQDRKPQFEKFIIAAQVHEAIGHAENPAFCTNVFNKVTNANGQKTIQAAYVEELGNIPCPHINGLNIAADVAQRIIANHIPRNQATTEAQLQAHAQHLTQRNLGLNPQQCQNIAQAIVNNNRTPVQALTVELNNIDCDGNNIAPQVAQLVMDQNIRLDAATRQASINKRVEILKARNLGLDDELCRRVAETVTGGNGNYVAALTQHLKATVVEQEDVKAAIAQKILNENKTLAVATREASIERRKGFIKGLNLGLADDVCERVAIDVTGGATYLQALQNRMAAENYAGENITPHIAVILWNERKPLAQATQQAKINKLAKVWDDKKLGLSAEECKHIAQAIVVNGKAEKDALAETLQTLAPYKAQPINVAVASFMLDRAMKRDAAIETAKVNIEKAELKVKDLTDDQLTKVATDIIRGMEPVKALAKVIKDVKGDDGSSLKDKVAEIMLAKGKKEDEAAHDALVAHRIANLENTLSKDFKQPQLKAIAEIMTDKKKSLEAAITEWVGPIKYNRDDLCDEIVLSLIKDKIDLKAAKEKAFVKSIALDMVAKHPSLVTLVETLAKVVYTKSLTIEKALTEHLLLAKDYIYSFKHTPKEVDAAVDRILNKKEKIIDVWHNLCVEPRIAKLKGDYPALEGEFLEPMAIESALRDLPPVGALIQVLVKNPKYAKVDHTAIAGLMIEDKASFAEAHKKFYTQRYALDLRKQGFDFLDMGTLKNICDIAYPVASIDTAADVNIQEEGLIPYIASVGIDDAEDFVAFLKNKKKSIPDLQGPYLVLKKTRELMAKYPNFPEETLHYAADKVVNDKELINEALLIKALKETQPICKEVEANGVYEMLTNLDMPFKDAVRAAKIHKLLASDVMKQFAADLDDRKVLAAIMVDENQPTPQAALALYCQQKNYDASEIKAITDAVFTQKKTLAQIDDIYGYKKYKKDYSFLSDEQAKLMAQLAVKHNLSGKSLIEKFVSEDELGMRKYQLEYPTLSDKQARFMAKLAFEHKGDREKMIKVLLAKETGAGSPAILKLAVEYFMNEDEKLTPKTAIEKAQYVHTQVETVDEKGTTLKSKNKIWNDYPPSEEELKRRLKTIAEYAFKNKGDLSIGVANYLKQSIKYDLHFKWICDNEAFHMPAYTIIAKKMLAGNMTFSSICDEFDVLLKHAREQHIENIKISVGHLFKPGPGGWKKHDTIIPLLLTKNAGEQAEAFECLITLGYFIHGLDGQFFAQQAHYAQSPHIADRDNFQRGKLKTALIDALATYYKKARAGHIQAQKLPEKFNDGFVQETVKKMLEAKRVPGLNTEEYDQCSFEEAIKLVSIDISESAKGFKGQYPYLPGDEVMEITANHLFLHKNDVREITIKSFIKDNKDKLGLDAQDDVDQYIPKLAAFITDIKKPTFKEAKLEFDAFLKRKSTELFDKGYGFTAEDCDAVIWQHLILGRELKKAIADIIVQKPDNAFPKEILDGKNPMQKRLEKQNFANAVVERLLLANKAERLTIAEAMQAQRIPNQKSFLRKNQGIKLPDNHLMTVATAMINRGKDIVGALVDLFKSEPKHFNLDAPLTEKEVNILADHMQKGAFFIPARYLALLEGAKSTVKLIADLDTKYNPTQKEMVLKLLSAELTISSATAKPVSLLDAMHNHWDKANGLLTQLSYGKNPSEFDLTLTLYHYLEQFKDKGHPAMEILNLETLKPMWIKARKWTYAHCLQTLNITDKHVDVDGAWKLDDIHELATALASKHISEQDPEIKQTFAPEAFLTAPIEDIVKTYRGLFNLIPKAVAKAKAELQQTILKGRDAAFAAEQKYLNNTENRDHAWDWDARNPRYYDAIEAGIKQFDVAQKPNANNDPLITTLNLKYDPHLKVPSIDHLPEVEVNAYRNARNLLQKAIANSSLDAEEKKQAMLAVGRFFAWGDLNDLFDGEKKYLDDYDQHHSMMKGDNNKNLINYRKRIMRIYNQLLKAPLEKNDMNELLGRLNVVIVQGKECIDASRQALDALEKGLPAEEKLGLFSRLASVLRGWRMDHLEDAGLQIAMAKGTHGSVELETEHALWMKIAAKHSLSIRGAEDIQSYHGAIKMDSGKVTKAITKMLEEYRKNFIDIVLSSIKDCAMPPEDNSPNDIYLVQIQEWAKTQRKYCNVVDLMSELTETVKKHVIVWNQAARMNEIKEQEAVVVKRSVIRELLEDAGYIAPTPNNR